VTFLTFIPLGFAWSYAENTAATAPDMDFFFLIQNTAMQLLGIFITIYPIRNSRKPSRKTMALGAVLHRRWVTLRNWVHTPLLVPVALLEWFCLLRRHSGAGFDICAAGPACHVSVWACQTDLGCKEK
jgi:hypothetical protein